uniref:Si:dkey-181m9.8 n=1 Tax=Seriola lalandi dorsalis TaxID=1841481 RepID=A0A3B4YIK5_SERLL
MTHCSCFLCQTCFKTFFSAAIKERSIDQLVCPQCGRPEVRGQGGMEESMDYFNLLDTQVRGSPGELRSHRLKLLINKNCSFGMLHEADRHTHTHTHTHWSTQHQGLSCDQFRVWQQQNQLDHHTSTLLSYNSIECPNCQFIFSLSKGGCLHFTCSQCQHQFCGGCSQTFTLGAVSPGSTVIYCRVLLSLHAHHPRDCLYHLRDWSVTRLHLLLQVTNTCCLTNSRVCLVLELRDDGSRREEPCGQPALPEYRGYCQLHYKERLVELINRCRADPAVLFSLTEIMAELQRWHVAMPTRKPDEPEPLYAQRLRLVSRHHHHHRCHHHHYCHCKYSLSV